MKGLKKILLIFLGLMLVFFLFLLWYQYRYSMDEVKPYAVNVPTLEKKLLIATQGSDFKDKVTTGIVEYFKPDSIYIQVVDVSSLENIDPKDFSAIVVIHTWENWKPPISVQSFIEKNLDKKNKIVVLTTSGEGTYKMEGVDAFTGESIVADVPFFVDKIVERVNGIILKEDFN